VEALQHFQHRTVLVLEEARRDVDTEIRCDPDEVLVEGAMVDRAEAEPIRHDRRARLLRVGDDVRGVEEPHLLQPADRAAVRVRGENGAAELRLVDALLDLTDDVAALDLVGDMDGLALVVRPAHLPECQEHAKLIRLVPLDIGGVDRPVPVGPRADEVHERHVQQVRASKPTV
jgi:hypothetical protein